MNRKATSGKGVSRLFTIILGLVLMVGGTGFLFLQQVNFLVGRSLLIAFGDAESTYRSAWFELDGDVVAKDVVVYPYGGEQKDVAVRFSTYHLETPGWFWFLRNAFNRKVIVGDLDRVHVTLTGVTSNEGVEPSLGDLGPIGAASASPFEAAGCLKDDLWIHSELNEMGLSPGTTTIDFDYRIEGTEVLTAVVLDTPGASSARLERREQLPKNISALLLDAAPTFVRSERWQVRDQGFVKARNAFCAKKDGVDAQTFVVRHVDTVVRMMEAGGLAADPASIEAYRSFAREGGDLSFGGDYIQPVPSTELYEAHETGAALLRMNGILERKGQRLAVQWRQFDPRPLKHLEELTPFAALQRERGVDPSAQPVIAEAATPNTGAQPQPSAPGAATGTATTAMAAASNTPAGTSAATSTPQPAPAAAALAAPGTQLAWSDLPRYRGHLLYIWTEHNPPRQMTLMDANGRELNVRVRMGGGQANYRIGKDAFLRATLIE